MPTLKIAPCLWFDDQAEPAAERYTSIFPDSRIKGITRYSDVGHEIHGRAPGSVMTVAFELVGQPFTALNGGPLFRFNEAISLEIRCDSQDEVDHYWHALSAGGAEQQCGWLKDRFGVSWQVVPSVVLEMVEDPDQHKVDRMFAALLQMRKLDIAALERAFAGTG